MLSIEIDFYFSEINKKTMSAGISHNNCRNIVSDKSGKYTYKSDLQLPTTLSIEIFGKNMNHDTVVDENGKIIADKYVAIKNIILDGIYLPLPVLQKLLKFYSDDGKQSNHDYIGFNGKCTLDFAKSNVFLQLADFERQISKE